jgi:stalled ribosome alternative rescue factor ArfA
MVLYDYLVQLYRSRLVRERKGKGERAAVG